MGEIVSLSRVRKAKSKADAKRQASENRVRFGRTKAEKLAEGEEIAARERLLDGLKRQDPADPV